MSGPSFVTVWPDGESQPGTSNLNVTTRRTIANLVICRLGEGGALRPASPINACDLVADVMGHFADQRVCARRGVRVVVIAPLWPSGPFREGSHQWLIQF